MEYGQDCKKLHPLMNSVWELRTSDVRIFGWFPRRSTFVAVGGAMKRDLKGDAERKDPYQPFINEVVTFRAKLMLDNPKSLTGRLEDVL